MLSAWQFGDSERLRSRIAPWAEIGLAPADVDPGDALLPWDQGRHALRYVHAIDEAETAALAQAAGLSVLSLYHADGHEGDLSLYAALASAACAAGARSPVNAEVSRAAAREPLAIPSATPTWSPPSAPTLAADPTLISVGPGRVNLIGEHTDYNDGFVLPVALKRDVRIAVRPRSDRRVRLLLGGVRRRLRL